VRCHSGIGVAVAEIEQSVFALSLQTPARKEDYIMVKDDRDILELLQEELAFIEQGGYGRSVSTPWLAKSAFQDSLTCINYGYPYRAHPCSECHLLDFVPSKDYSKPIPCHCIPLNDAGVTIEDLEALDNQSLLEATLKQWLRSTINEIAQSRQPLMPAGAK
jgi:hypothetical protein